MDDTKLTLALQQMNIDDQASLTPPLSATFEQKQEINRHLQQFDLNTGEDDSEGPVRKISPEIAAAPLFSSKVKQSLHTSPITDKPELPAFGLLGMRTAAYNAHTIASDHLPQPENLIYANLQHPWTTFICGQQGAGKSHTMSCLLENALLKGNAMGPNPNPMTGVVFHYDKFSSTTAAQECEAAYLSSKDIKVQVLVSPANLKPMRQRYRNLPGVPKGSPKPEVIPFLFNENQLNVANMKTLMGMDNDDKTPPLYMAVVNKVLKDLAVQAEKPVVMYGEMKRLVERQGLQPAQTSFLTMRYSLIEWFLRQYTPQSVREKAGNIDFSPRTILIVDLSCPFVTESDACSLFSIFLSIFLAQRGERPLIIALDEAHKFLTETPAAKAFTDDLVQIIRQQRHLAARVIIATQEPTISPKLLDLCNVAIVHQFQSPEWYEVLKRHLAALATTTAAAREKGEGSEPAEDVFRTIVRLRRGEALVFCPKAYFDVEGGGQRAKFRPLDDGYAKIMVRKKITADGGKSIVASDAKRELRR